MGHTKDLNKVTKSLILSLHAAGKQRKDIANYVGCSKASVSRVINTVALKGRAACEKQKKITHKMTDSFAKLSRPTGSRQPSNSPKMELCFGGEKSLLQSPFVVSGRLASATANLQQNPCLTASTS